MLKATEWPPDRLFSVHPAFWYGVSKAGTHKITVSTFEELDVHVKRYLERMTPENRRAEAEAWLDFELRWHGHEHGL